MRSLPDSHSQRNAGGCRKIIEKICVILDALETHEDTGDELLLSIGNIEDSSPVGRLYDIDIIDTDGHKLSRSHYRKCLICSKQAQECARSRTHTVSEMQDAVEKLLQNL